jgi:hypothetical protein
MVARLLDSTIILLIIALVLCNLLLLLLLTRTLTHIDIRKIDPVDSIETVCLILFPLPVATFAIQS